MDRMWDLISLCYSLSNPLQVTSSMAYQAMENNRKMSHAVNVKMEMYTSI